MRTIFSVCSGIGSIFQIFPLTVNQRPETATLLPSGLVYLLLCFLSKVSTHHGQLLRLFKERTDGKLLPCFYIQFTLMEIDSDL